MSERVAGRDGTDEDPLLAVEGLETHYPVREGLLRREVDRVRAVDGVSFDLRRGEALGVVGESGSGKTTLAHSILGLEEPTGGSIRFDGRAVGDLSGDALDSFRRRVQLIVQDPGDALSPRMRVGEAVAEPLVLHGMGDTERRRAIVEDALERVDLAAGDADRYPHEFSSGERQRIAIARALVVDPDLLVADEPTSALDGRTKARVLELLDEIRREYDVSLLFVSHDVDVVERFCDRVAVMYLGELVERGPVGDVLSAPAHPYTRLLVDSAPSLDPGVGAGGRPLTDAMPDVADPPDGCRFHSRCPAVIQPDGVDLSPERWRAVAAFRFTLEAGDLPAAVTGDAPDEKTVREAFDLPESFRDSTVEAAVDDAVAALASGARDEAVDRLAETFETVCERDAPATVRTDDGRPVLCHRYDDERTGEPRSR
ncbi:MAG: oligopeptide/dipeptide ABC transporter ATP-binding protein [Haloarculaceae archaeon]